MHDGRGRQAFQQVCVRSMRVSRVSVLAASCVVSHMHDAPPPVTTTPTRLDVALCACSCATKARSSLSAPLIMPRCRDTGIQHDSVLGCRGCRFARSLVPLRQPSGRQRPCRTHHTPVNAGTRAHGSKYEAHTAPPRRRAAPPRPDPGPERACRTQPSTFAFVLQVCRP